MPAIYTHEHFMLIPIYNSILNSHFSFTLRPIFTTPSLHAMTLDHLTIMSSQSTQDLTSQVTKTDSRSFDYGGNADIWKGLWIKNDSGYAVPVQTYQPAH
jgi:hypothetical protein